MMSSGFPTHVEFCFGDDTQLLTLMNEYICKLRICQRYVVGCTATARCTSGAGEQLLSVYGQRMLQQGRRAQPSTIRVCCYLFRYINGCIILIRSAYLHLDPALFRHNSLAATIAALFLPFRAVRASRQCCLFAVTEKADISDFPKTCIYNPICW
jgi:hypothetical protein